MPAPILKAQRRALELARMAAARRDLDAALRHLETAQKLFPVTKAQLARMQRAFPKTPTPQPKDTK